MPGLYHRALAKLMFNLGNKKHQDLLLRPSYQVAEHRSYLSCPACCQSVGSLHGWEFGPRRIM